MLSKQRFNVLQTLVDARAPDLSKDFSSYEYRTVEDVRQWLNKNMSKPNGWDREDVSWGVSEQSEPLPPSPSPQLPDGKMYDPEQGLAMLAQMLATADPLWAGFPLKKWADRWIAGEFVKDIK